MAEKSVQNYKKEAVAEFKESFEGVKDIIFTNYRGLSVKDITELRTEIRKSDATLHVVKNNFAKVAFKDLEIEGVDEFLVGPTAIAFCRGESSPVAKALAKLAGDKEVPFELKGARIEGDVYSLDQLVEYSKLPSRSELIARMLGSLQSPLQNFVYALNAIQEKESGDSEEE